MPILAGLLMLLVIYLLWKMFVDGWLFKGILFFAGWFGLFIGLHVMGVNATAFTMGDGTAISWAAVIPTIVCLLCLLCTKTSS